jgi:hypothetical protein
MLRRLDDPSGTTACAPQPGADRHLRHGPGRDATATDPVWHPVAVTITLVSAAATILLVVRLDDIAALL